MWVLDRTSEVGIKKLALADFFYLARKINIWILITITELNQ